MDKCVALWSGIMKTFWTNDQVCIYLLANVNNVYWDALRASWVDIFFKGSFNFLDVWGIYHKQQLALNEI